MVFLFPSTIQPVTRNPRRSVGSAFAPGTVRWAVWVAALFLSLRATVAAAEAPFAHGETLEFGVQWGGIPVGRASLRVNPESYLGREAFRIVSHADSNDFLSLIFPVQDRVESIIDAAQLTPFQLQLRQRHGRRSSDRMIVFDRDAGTAAVTGKGKTAVYDVPAGVQDVLSSLYYVRTLPALAPGTSVFVNVFESRKNWITEIQILKTERIIVPAGSFDTVKVKAVVRYEGLLMTKGDAYFWLTNDARRIPVQLEGEVAIGSVRAMLQSVEGPPMLQAAHEPKLNR